MKISRPRGKGHPQGQQQGLNWDYSFLIGVILSRLLCINIKATSLIRLELAFRETGL
jgi:hypothetical protein